MIKAKIRLKETKSGGARKKSRSKRGGGKDSQRKSRGRGASSSEVRGLGEKEIVLGKKRVILVKEKNPQNK